MNLGAFHDVIHIQADQRFLQILNHHLVLFLIPLIHAAPIRIHNHRPRSPSELDPNPPSLFYYKIHPTAQALQAQAPQSLQRASSLRIEAALNKVHHLIRCYPTTTQNLKPIRDRLIIELHSEQSVAYVPDLPPRRTSRG